MVAPHGCKDWIDCVVAGINLGIEDEQWARVLPRAASYIHVVGKDLAKPSLRSVSQVASDVGDLGNVARYLGGK